MAASGATVRYNRRAMKSVPIVLLAVVVALLIVIVFAYRQMTVTRERQQQIGVLRTRVQDLRERPTTTSAASELLDLQAKCSTQAPETVRHFGWKAGDGISSYLSHTNHFNRQLNRCIVMVRSSDPVAGQEGRSYYFRLFVVDAFEFTTYGEYVELVDLGAPGESFTGWVKTCKVMLPVGGSKSCNSQVEFEQLIRVYVAD